MNYGLTKAPDGELPVQRSMKDLWGSRVIEINRPPRDQSINEDIQKYGAHLTGGDDEYSWYKKHKGYSKKEYYHEFHN